MKVKEGTSVELAVRTVHGRRRFPLTHGCPSAAGVGPDNERSTWMSFEVAVQGKHRGVPEKMLLSVDIPLDEFGNMFSNGGHARGVVGWSFDDATKRGKKVKR